MGVSITSYGFRKSDSISRSLFLSYHYTGDFFQSSIMIEKRDAENSQDSEKARILPSLRFISNFFTLHAGSRYLPGPSSFYLADSSFFSGFSDMDPGRTRPVFFFQLFPDFFAPGLFMMKGSKKAGVFISDRTGRFLLSLHPETSTGNFSLSLGRDSLPFKCYFDVFKVSRTAEGYIHINRNEDKDAFQFIMEAERKESWDQTNMEEDDLSRKGRSALAFLQIENPVTGYFRMSLSGAGQDTGNTGYRMAEMKIFSVSLSQWGNPVLRGRVYRKQIYGSDEKKDDDNKNELNSVSAGWTSGKKNGFAIFLEKRSSGNPAGELQIFIRNAFFHLSLSAVFSPEKKIDDEEFLFIQKNSVQGSNSAFLETRSALFLTLKNEFLYFQISSLIDAENKKEINGNFQLRMKF